MKRKMIALIGGLSAALATFAAGADGGAPKPRVYILKGYSFSGLPGVNTDEIVAKLKDKAGARITSSDIAADNQVVAKELQDRRIPGRLFTSIAEKHGSVWVIFDVLQSNQPLESLKAHLAKAGQHLAAQTFEGASGMSASDLAAATGLKKGDALSPQNIDAARQAITAFCAKSMPGNTPKVRLRMQFAPDGAATLTWIIGGQ
jgi:outer membrane protein assembly factor BamA